jgi:glycosyltransferase involved in cell wall biosynthesis
MFTNPTWHLITGEYPEQLGGVSDYTRLVAGGLAAAGEDVQVWAPPFAGNTPVDPGVTVHRLPAAFGRRSLRQLDAALGTWPRPGRILLQYVPHAFGWKAMNVPFARWLRRRRQPLWVMFHEVVFPRVPGQSLKHRLLSMVTARMARWIAVAAERIFVASPSWRDSLERLTPVADRAFWAPIPSNLPTAVDPVKAPAQRERYQVPADRPLVGHFGTFGHLITGGLTPALVELMRRRPDCHFLLMGRDSDRYAQSFPDQAKRVHATGILPAGPLSECLSACDVMLQPYPDGISCRRGSAMACLALGRPLVTTLGALSEPIWDRSAAVALAPAGRTDELVGLVDELLNGPERRQALGESARQFYAERFALERTINVLLGKETPQPFPDELVCNEIGPRRVEF